MPPTDGTGAVVVTGGANGIGAAIVDRLLADGRRVASLDVAEPPPPRDGVLDIRCDLADPDAATFAVARVREALGPIGAVVHSAAFQVIAPFDGLDTDTWRRTFAVNVDGLFHVLQAALPDLRAGAGRVVVLTSSTLQAPSAGMVHYVASKGALLGLVRALATELGPDGVTVNAVAPGLTRSAHAVAHVPEEHFALVRSRQALPRSGAPDDIAGAVAFLLSTDAAFITGQTLLVDGGESRL